MYTIKEVAEIEELSTYTVRYYHDEGLLPHVTRDKNNNRLFSEEDLRWLHFIKCLRNMRMPLAQIKKYIDLCLVGDESVPERLALLIETRVLAMEELAKLQKEMATLDWKIDIYQEALKTNKKDLWNPFQDQEIVGDRVRRNRND